MNPNTSGQEKKWISVTEKELPYSDDCLAGPYNIAVLKPNGDYYISHGYLYNEKWCWSEGKKKEISPEYKVTHYMELPDPPQIKDMKQEVPPEVLKMPFEKQQEWLVAESKQGRYYAKLASKSPSLMPEEKDLTAKIMFNEASWKEFNAISPSQSWVIPLMEKYAEYSLKSPPSNALREALQKVRNLIVGAWDDPVISEELLAEIEAALLSNPVSSKDDEEPENFYPYKEYQKLKEYNDSLRHINGYLETQIAELKTSNTWSDELVKSADEFLQITRKPGFTPVEYNTSQRALESAIKEYKKQTK